MPLLSKDEKRKILLLIDFVKMKCFAIKIVIRVNDEWQLELDGEALYAELRVMVTKNAFGLPEFTQIAKAGLVRLSNKSDAKNEMEKVEVEIFGASAEASFSPTYVGVKVKLTAMQCDASLVHVHVGVGFSTGIGLKDDSLKLKVGGCGIQVGRKWGISFLGNELSVDFGKLSCLFK